MAVPVRISAELAREKCLAGDALLVCAYEGAEKFEMNHLEGAITWQMFESRRPELAKDHTIIFYCA